MMGRLIPADTGFEYYRHVHSLPAVAAKERRGEPPPPPPLTPARGARRGEGIPASVARQSGCRGPRRFSDNTISLRLEANGTNVLDSDRLRATLLARGSHTDLIPYLTAGQIEALLHAAALLAGAIAFAAGLYQYRRAQAWKRHEFVAGEITRFNSDPLARNAMLMIDWGTREIELFPSHPDYAARFVLVTRPVLYPALATHNKIGRPFTRTEATIRDCFDSFFGGLERFEQFIQAGLVSAGEFQPYLAYWIRSICEDANPELRSILDEYVAFYRFDGVPALFRRYGKHFGHTSIAAPRREVADRYEEHVRTADTRAQDVTKA